MNNNGGPSPPTRHRADDDMDALATGSFAPPIEPLPSSRTPNGDVDLLSESAASTLTAAANTTSPFSIDDGDDIVNLHDELPPRDPSADHMGGDDDNVSLASASSRGSRSTPRAPPGKTGAKMNKLSVKTTNIMSAYQTYLAEIEAEFPSTPEDDPTTNASTNLSAARENVREGYNSNDITAANLSSLTPVVEDGLYATGAHNQPLARSWDYSRNGLSIDRTGGGYHDDVTSMTENDFEGHISLVRGQNYTHPSSKRVKRAACMIVGVAILIGVSVGISVRRRDEKMDMLDGEMNAETLEGAAGGDTEMVDPSNLVDPAIFNKEHQDRYKNEVLKFKPLLYDRDKGWLGRTYTEALVFCASKPGYAVCPYELVCPEGEDGDPLGGNKSNPAGGQSWVPILDAPNEWVQIGARNQCIPYSHIYGELPTWGMTGQNNEPSTQNIMCCLGEDLVTQATGEQRNIAYKTAMIKYAPKTFNRQEGWEGQTFAEAANFCKNVGLRDVGVGVGYAICPYDAICPLGPENEPTGGYKEIEEGDAWVPLLNALNAWVNIGKENMCVAYSHIHHEQPVWGKTGEGNEEITQNIACCLEQDETHGMEEAIMYELAEEKYRPILFDHGKGWEGQTYDAAEEFCGDIEGYELCPYEALCPLGQYSTPISSFQDGPSNWIPIMDMANEWVQISEANSCTQHSHMYADPADFTVVGEEEVTNYIMCCSKAGFSVDPNAAPPKHPTSDKSGVKAPLPAIITSEGLKTYTEAAERYTPQWFNRDNGWQGSTYLQAIEFCNLNPTRILCPLAAICPLGQDTTPLGGAHNEPEGSWVPIMDMDNPNNWVQTSEGKGGMCIRYDHEHEAMPEWGLNGEGDEAFTRHVACCAVEDLTVMETAPKDTSAATAAEMIVAEVVEELTEEEVEVEDEEEAEISEPAGMDPAYMEMSEKYLLLWRSRERGYNGQTYLEAEEYCAKIKPNFGICPYEAICPLGKNSEPLGGFKPEQSQSWVPILDEQNNWVQVSNGESQGETCIHSSDQLDLPDWGISGIYEDMTRHVACCLIQDTPMIVNTPTIPAVADVVEEETLPTFPPQLPAMEAALAENAALPSGVDTAEETSMIYQSVSIRYRPRWFDRSTGWKGRTFEDAFLFCFDFRKAMPCLYEAICPMGPHTMPVGGYKEEPSGSWAPLQDDRNSWVQLGEDGGCLKYSHLHTRPPVWGETGEDNEELTRHIACCNVISDKPTTSPTVDSTPDPTVNPTPLPTMEPTNLPTTKPTLSPTNLSTTKPTLPPTSPPTSPKPTLPPTSPPTTTKPSIDFYEYITMSLEPLPFDRDSGWNGSTYLEALQFCAQKVSRVPCPYQGYCPMGIGNTPFGGMKDSVNWSPIIDAPNAWVQIGDEDTCLLYSELNRSPPRWGLTGKNAEDITRNIKCCLEEPLMESPTETVERDLPPYTEQEQAVLDTFKPQWFGRNEGYQGTTYAESEEFCNNVAGMELCPLSAYCPNGPPDNSDELPLYLQLPPFEGESWAPMNDDNVDSVVDFYVLIGIVSGNPTTTCLTYSEVDDDPMPLWGLDGSRPDLNALVLCCKDPLYTSNGISHPAVDLSIGGPDMSDQQLDEENVDIEGAIMKNLQPEWLSVSDGWLGGSHDDAEMFCDALGGRQICPYVAYCPHGPGQPISAGHTTDISAEGIQYAPVLGHENHWVMVGNKHNNVATTCFGHEDLEGVPPEWGLTTEKHEIKRHIMCCVVNV